MENKPNDGSPSDGGEAAAELRDGDGGGDRCVERFRAWIADRIGRYVKAVGHEPFHAMGNAVGFVADDYDNRPVTACFQLAGIDVFPVEESAIHLATML